MTGMRIKFGKLWGITFQIDPSWFIVFALITLTLTSQFSDRYPHWNLFVLWSTGLLTSLLFFVSVLLHELAHSVVAIARGIPVRSITLFIFGGVAQISREATRPITEFLVAAAGPAASVGIASFFGLVWVLARERVEVVSALAGWLGAINLILAVFNLIPGFPLDGGRILRSIIWGASGSFEKATRVATTLGRLVAYSFIILGIWIAFQGNVVNGLWLGFIGWFLLGAAHQTYQQVLLRETLAGIKARELMKRDYPRISAGLNLKQFVEDFLARSGYPCFLVTDEAWLRGIVTLQDVKRVPREKWDGMRVDEVMTPWQRLKWVSPHHNVIKILEGMEREELSEVPVVEQGHVVGIVGRQEILQILQNRLQVSA